MLSSFWYTVFGNRTYEQLQHVLVGMEDELRVAMKHRWDEGAGALREEIDTIKSLMAQMRL